MDYQDLVQKYLDTWNLPAESRGAAIAGVFTDDVVYADPNIELRGPEALNDYIGQTQQQLAGLVFSLAGSVDGHHNQARFAWQCGPAGGRPVATGFDVALFRDGRVAALYGFFD